MGDSILRDMGGGSAQKFDRAVLASELADLGRKFGELHYICLADAWIREVSYYGGPNDPADPTPDHGAAPDDDSGGYGFTWHYAVSNPFDVVYPIGLQVLEAWESRIPTELEKIRVYAGSWGESQVDQIRTAIEELIAPDTAPLAESCRRLVAGPVDTLDTDHVPSDLGRIGRDLDDWHGESFDAFVDGFYNPFSEIVTRHQGLSATLAGMVAVSKAIIDSAQFGVMNVVMPTGETLQGLLDQWAAAHAPRPFNWNALIAAGSKVTELVGLIPNPVATVGSTVGGEILGILDSQVDPPDPEQITTPTVTAEDMIDQCLTQLGRVRTNTDRAWRAPRPEDGKTWPELLRDEFSDFRENENPLFPPAPHLVPGEENVRYRPTDS